MSTFTSKNNFAAFKKDFESETGLTAKDNTSLYIQYYSARASDGQMQLQTFYLQQIHNRLSERNNK